jgi:hypothetical protein
LDGREDRDDGGTWLDLSERGSLIEGGCGEKLEVAA